MANNETHLLSCNKRISLRLDCNCDEIRAKRSIKERAITDNTELVADLMTFSPYGALSQVFIIEAIRRYAAACATTKIADNPLLSGEAWQGVAKDIKCRMDAFYNCDTADSDGGDHD